MSRLPDPQSSMELSVHDVAKWIHLPAGERPRLIDCRERSEVDFCRIEGSEWLPLREFPQSMERFDSNVERGVVVYCHHGMRSMHAVVFLRARGIEQSFSMAGGIEQWSREVDEAVERY